MSHLRSTVAALSMVVLVAAGDIPADAPVTYRGRSAVEPTPDGMIIAEAEEFNVDGDARGGAWASLLWGENYYCATFGNTFLSRKWFLGAPEQADEAKASIRVRVPTSGKYLALVRYEAVYRFETRFRLVIEQGGAVKLDRLYGARDNLKVWAFGARLKKEATWDWGAVENVVWEGHEVQVDLEAGEATLTLIAGAQPEPAARRNVDLVLLTRDEEDVKERIAKEGYLPLDGLLTQAGDVHLRVANRSDARLDLTVQPGKEHSPYWVHIRRWKPKKIEVAGGATSEWEEVGSLLDTLNDGAWTINALSEAKPLDYRLEFGLRAAGGEIELIAAFDSTEAEVRLAYDADTRYQRRIRKLDQVLYDLLDDLKRHPVRGTPPRRTIVYGYTFDSRREGPAASAEDRRYNDARREFIRLMGLTVNRLGDVASATVPSGYIDLRDQTPEQIAKSAEKHRREAAEEGREWSADQIRTVSLGDEIGLPKPSGDAHTQFREWARAFDLRPEDIAPSAEVWTDVRFDPAAKEARLRYYSTLFTQDYGIARLKLLTHAVKQEFPKADTGANFSPHHGAYYLGEAHKWITLFRRGGMTMPWSEDYVWQVPIGSQQMNFILLDLMRAANRRHPERDIQFYVMPHMPGNTPNNWRRLLYGCLGHGMTILNLFELRPVHAAYTENHVSDPAMYREIRKSLYELATFEDVVQEGRVRPGVAALWYSRAGDVWENHRDPFAAGKRTLYIAVRHQQLPLDIVDEEDALRGELAGYRVLYLADRNVSRAASRAIAKWVAAGGRLFATAGAGMRDEFDEPNDVLAEMMGVREMDLVIAPERVRLEKQDLPFAKPIDEVKVRGHATSVPVFGATSRLRSEGAEVLGTFKDGSPALTLRPVGEGTAYYCAFLPGLSYFKPAIPLRPVDRGSRNDSMAHFVPSAFDPVARSVVGLAVEGVARPVVCSNPLIDASLIESARGRVVILSNWSGGPVRGLGVTLSEAGAFEHATLATGGQVAVTRDGAAATFTLDLDHADAIIMR